MHPGRLSGIARRVGERTGGISTRRAVILALVVCALALTLSMPLRTYFSQRGQLADAAQQHQQLLGEIDRLQQEKAKLNDPHYVEMQARTRLGFVKAGETPYLVQLPGDSPPPPETDPTAPTKKPGDPWYTSLWKSVSQPLPTAAPPPGPMPMPVEPPSAGAGSSAGGAP